MTTQADNTTNKANNEKATMDWGLDENNTPRKLKAMEPDVTVIVGGVQFFHYKAFLCTCGFFDKMLSSHMKESESSVIEFPDRNPEEWLEVYKFLDPFNYTTKMDQRVSSWIKSSDYAETLLPWFDYLGMEEHLAHCDNKLRERFWCSNDPPSYATWEQYKFTHNCPNTKDAIIDAAKFFAHKTAEKASSKTEELEELKKFMFDDECGDELWTYFIEKVANLPRGMLDELDKDSLVNSPMFKYMIETNRRQNRWSQYKCARNFGVSEDAARRTRKQQAAANAANDGRPAAKPAAIRRYESSSEEESSDEEVAARRRPPARVSAPARKKSFFDDSDSDSESS